MIRIQKFDRVNHRNFSLAYDDRASVTVYADTFNEVEEKVNKLSDKFNPSLNIIYFNTSSTEAKNFLKSEFKLTKLPAIHVLG